LCKYLLIYAKNIYKYRQTKESEVKTVYVSDEESVGEPLFQTTIKRVNIVDENIEPEEILEIKIIEKTTDIEVVEKKKATKDTDKDSIKDTDRESLLLKQKPVVEALTLTKKSLSSLDVPQDSQKTVKKN